MADKFIPDAVVNDLLESLEKDSDSSMDNYLKRFNFSNQLDSKFSLPRIGTDYGLPSPVVPTASIKVVEPPPPSREDILAMMDKIKEQMDKHIHQAFFVPNDLLHQTAMNLQTVRNAVQVAAIKLQDEVKKVSDTFNKALPNIFGMPIFTHHIPGPVIGSWFNAVPYSKHRSKRLWKKLRYGTRKNSRITTMYGPPPLYVISDPKLMLANPASFNEITRSI